MKSLPETILVVGSGGREHAIVWALSRSPHEPTILAAPGNPGTADRATNVDVAAGDVDALVQLALDRGVDLVIIGPEQPLVDGLADRLREEGIPVVGPSAAAARLEGSKSFSKAFMQRHDIPTAAYRSFTADQIEEARRYIREQGAPIVVKASGLAAGKGAIVCPTLVEALEAVEGMLGESLFGEAGETVVVEEFMEGEEASVFALTDGTDYVLLPPSQDHKQIEEGDRGPNTGGMGAYAPAPVVTDEVMERVRKEIIEPTLVGMANEGYPYSGILYVGLMLTPAGPRVVEYNCRLGDPEAQVVLPLLETDAVELFAAIASEQLGSVNVLVSDDACACVVMASHGYPGTYEKGKPITGVEQVESAEARVFQAGTRRDSGGLVTDGGRVLAVSANGTTLKEALEVCYRGIDRISFDGATFRRDIGAKGLKHLAKR